LQKSAAMVQDVIQPSLRNICPKRVSSSLSSLLVEMSLPLGPRASCSSVSSKACCKAIVQQAVLKPPDIDSSLTQALRKALILQLFCHHSCRVACNFCREVRCVRQLNECLWRLVEGLCSFL